MSDPISQARQARTHLMQALSVLQQDDVPPDLQATAEGVARVMSLLHRIETKGEQTPTATEALTLLRGVLNQLQAPENAHPTGEAALEIVAGSLGLVHQLARAFPAPGPVAPPPPVPAAAPDPLPVTQRKDSPILAPTPVDPAPLAKTPPPLPPSTVRNTNAEALGNAATQAYSVDEVPTRQAPLLPPEPASDARTVESPVHRSAPSEEAIPLSRVSGPPTLPSAPPTPAIPAGTERPSYNPEPQRTSYNPEPQRTSSNPEPQRISSNPISLPSLPPLPGELFVEAALGAYSTTNFFKGLSGNDVIDAGGLFIATYAPPEVDQKVRAHVSLPGGFEFQARGQVTWVREMPKTGSLNPLSPPGYGVKFTELSKEARQLVYRYVRNREPLFHDDL